MTAMNVVRMLVKPGCGQAFEAAHRAVAPRMPGFRGGRLVKTGERSYCLVGEWSSFQRIVAARPAMIAVLDGMRDLLENLGGDLGVTDPVSGEVVASMRPAAAKRKAPTRKAKIKAKGKGKARVSRRARGKRR